MPIYCNLGAVEWMRRPAAVTGGYALIALAMTWPLAIGLARDVPSDLSDPLLNCWILAWTANRAIAVVNGDLGAAASFWHANTFHPEPLTLAYSEHLVPQALTIAPVYAASGELILSYNLLFLSTFVLSGLGMFLFMREVTGAWHAAFVAGLVYAFVPYRVAQISHLPVLSSQWMPFALFGLRRFFDTGRRLPLAGAAAATAVQGLSSAYYLAYFTPFLVAYVLYESIRRGRLKDVRLWRSLVASGVAVAALTAPFLAPYVRLRAEGFVRAVPSAAYSADLASYLTAPGDVWLWGSVLRPYPLPESDLFPGIVPFALAALALARLKDERRALAIFSAGAMLVAAWLSLGPTVHLFGEPLSAGLYAAYYRFVPGVDGLRVPARIGMIAMLFLAVASGLGVLAMAQPGRRSTLAALLLGGLFLVEACPAPIPMNRVGPGGGSVLPPPGRAHRGHAVPPVYRAVARLPSDAVVIELPFGYRAHEAQYVYYSTFHWQKLVNGYSSWRPPAYRTTQRRLATILTRPGRAWQAVLDSGATHLIVHEGSFEDGRGRDISAWAIGRGARLLGTWRGDSLFELPARSEVLPN